MVKRLPRYSPTSPVVHLAGRVRGPRVLDEAIESLGGLTAAVILTWLRATEARRAPSP
jgi:hypothetical protein